MDKATFGFDPYHILLTGCGLAIIAAYWLPRYFRGREPAASGLLILGGLAVFGLLPGVPDALNPIDRPRVWELASEFAVIIALFGAAIEQLVALAVLMPIVASIGGNAGTQTMAVTVRAIATNQLTRSNTRRILMREIRVAVLNGLTIAVLVGLATGVIFTPMLGGVIALAMVINVITAGLAGVLVPVAFERLDQDPAVASSVFVTMITDSMGFFAFLGLAVACGVTG